MLTRHKSSCIPNINLAFKMKQGNTLTAEEEEGSGKDLNAKILQNLSAAFLQFNCFTTITFLEDNLITRIGKRT
jgi:ABC-type microcin C transport system duplicated ATPase subunit YejF